MDRGKGDSATLLSRTWKCACLTRSACGSTGGWEVGGWPARCCAVSGAAIAPPGGGGFTPNALQISIGHLEQMQHHIWGLMSASTVEAGAAERSARWQATRSSQGRHFWCWLILRDDGSLPKVRHDVLGLQVRQAQVLRVLRLVQQHEHPAADAVVPAHSAQTS